MVRLIQVLWENARIGEGIEFEDGAIIIRWHTGEGTRAYDAWQDLYGDASTRGARVLALSPPTGWLKDRAS